MIEIEISNENLLKSELKKIEQGLKNRRGLMRAISGTMESAVLQNFDAGGRPSWLGLKYREGKPLVDTHRLMTSIEASYDNDNAIVGTNEEYAAIHQFGGKAGRGKKVDIIVIHQFCHCLLIVFYCYIEYGCISVLLLSLKGFAISLVKRT